MSKLSDAKETAAELAHAMELLGQGTLAELRSLGLPTTPKVLDEALELLIVPAPMRPRGAFVLSESAETLSRVVAEAALHEKELVVGAVGLLCERGDFQRAGTILTIANGAVDGSAPVIAHSLEFIDHGFTDLVETYVFDSAFRASPVIRSIVTATLDLMHARLSRADDALQLAQRLLRRHARAKDPRDTPSTPAERTLWTQARALFDAYSLYVRGERAWRGPDPFEGTGRGASALLRKLEILAGARRLCLKSQLGKALAILEAEEAELRAGSVVDSLLATELFTCRSLTGARSTHRQREGMRQAIAFLDGLGFELFCRTSESHVLLALGISSESGVIPLIQNQQERVAHHPNRSLKAALALSLACAYVRQHSYFAAHSQVRQLVEELAADDAMELAYACYVVKTLSAELVDEGIEPPPQGKRTQQRGLAPLAKLIYAISLDMDSVAQTVDGSPFAKIFDKAKPTSVAKTLAGLVIDSPWKQAKAFKRLLPKAWIPEEGAGDGREGAVVAEALPRPAARAKTKASELYLASLALEVPEPGGIGVAHPHLRLVPPSASASIAAVAKPGRGEAARPKLSLEPLRIRLLGEFEVYQGGLCLEAATWRRKAARELLRVLAVVPSHSLSRAEVCEFLWPDRDFILSRNGLYSVLSCIRKTLGCKADGPSYLHCENGRLALDAKLVSVDTDEFERLCREVLSREGDRSWRLTLCRHLGSLYAGGLRLPSQDVRGDFAAKQRKLQALYVDMLAEGSDVALKEGYVKEALWFAHDARTLEPLREDVVDVLLRALAADGRRVELNAVYRAFSAQLAKELLMAPPARLEALVRELNAFLDRGAADGGVGSEGSEGLPLTA